MKLTRIDLNSWILQIAEQTILLDPWLVDPLEFYGIPWLFKAYHNTPLVYTPETLPPIDLILISQALDDHCHQPTLKQLDHTIPVVAPPTARGILKRLGYTNVTELSTWQEHQFRDKLKIVATPGAKIQGRRENGYVLKDSLTGESIYYEPHLFSDEIGDRIERIDVAIAPVVGQVFPLLGQVIMGPCEAANLVKRLRPKAFVPTSIGSIRQEGILPMLIKERGSIAEFSDRLAASGLSTQLLTPEPGETLELGNLATSN